MDLLPRIKARALNSAKALVALVVPLVVTALFELVEGVLADINGAVQAPVTVGATAALVWATGNRPLPEPQEA
jgi:uncharacterized protein (DUF697 family)